MRRSFQMSAVPAFFEPDASAPAIGAAAAFIALSLVSVALVVADTRTVAMVGAR